MARPRKGTVPNVLTQPLQPGVVASGRRRALTVVVTLSQFPDKTLPPALASGCCPWVGHRKVREAWQRVALAERGWEESSAGLGTKARHFALLFPLLPLPSASWPALLGLREELALLPRATGAREGRPRRSRAPRGLFHVGATREIQSVPGSLRMSQLERSRDVQLIPGTGPEGR